MYFITYFYDTNKTRNYIKMINDPIKSYCIKVGNLLVPVDYFDSQLKGQINFKIGLDIRGKTEIVSTKENTDKQGLILVKNVPVKIRFKKLINIEKDIEKDLEKSSFPFLIVMNRKKGTYDYLYLKEEI